MSWYNNRRKSKPDSVKNDLTGELVPELGERLLSNIEDAGLEDGLAGIKGGADMKGLGSAIRIMLTRTQLEVIGQYKQLKKLIGDLESGLQELKARVESLREHLHEQREKVKLANGILYTFAGFIYILGDIEFSRQIILSSWGLGRGSLFAQFSLILGLGMAPVLGKLVYARFIEDKYDKNAKVQPCIINWFFLAITPLVVLFFAYLGYVRGVIFEYVQFPQHGDIYEALYNAHPFMNTIAFIGMALILLTGGSVLLTVGMNELKRHSMYRADKKTLRKLEKEQKHTEQRLDRLYQEYHMVEALHDLYADDKSFNQLVETKAEFYASLYFWNHLRGERKRVDKEINQLPDENFHLFVRKVLDMKSRDGSLKKEGIRYG